MISENAIKKLKRAANKYRKNIFTLLLTDKLFLSKTWSKGFENYFILLFNEKVSLHKNYTYRTTAIKVVLIICYACYSRKTSVMNY